MKKNKGKKCGVKIRKQKYWWHSTLSCGVGCQNFTPNFERLCREWPVDCADRALTGQAWPDSFGTAGYPLGENLAIEKAVREDRYPRNHLADIESKHEHSPM